MIKIAWGTSQPTLKNKAGWVLEETFIGNATM